MARHRWQIDRSLHIPLDEVSGICGYRRPGRPPSLAAIGDASARLVIGEAHEGTIRTWSSVALDDLAGGLIPRRNSQAEAVAADSGGLVVVLVEEPSAAFVLDLDGARLVSHIELHVAASHPLAADWERDPNSRGEGLTFLAGGHLLVAKEKNPPALIEFGPVGDEPLGFGPDRLLRPDAPWSPPTGPTTRFEALATWMLDDDLADELDDVSDVAVDFEGRLHLLSDQSSRIALVSASSAVVGSRVRADGIARIDGKPDKAEGLAWLPDGRALVALDRTGQRDNLLLLTR